MEYVGFAERENAAEDSRVVGQVTAKTRVVNW